MGRLARQWPTPPGALPPYYLRLSIAPVMRQKREALHGFGPFWETIRLGLPASMTRTQLIEFKLCTLSAWISEYEETVRTVP